MGKNGTSSVDLKCVCVKAVPKKHLKGYLLGPRTAMLFIKTFYAVLLTYLNFNLGKLAFEGRKSRSAVTGNFSSA